MITFFIHSVYNVGCLWFLLRCFFEDNCTIVKCFFGRTVRRLPTRCFLSVQSDNGLRWDELTKMMQSFVSLQVMLFSINVVGHLRHCLSAALIFLRFPAISSRGKLHCTLHDTYTKPKGIDRTIFGTISKVGVLSREGSIVTLAVLEAATVHLLIDDRTFVQFGNTLLCSQQNEFACTSRFLLFVLMGCKVDRRTQCTSQKM